MVVASGEGDEGVDKIGEEGQKVLWFSAHIITSPGMPSSKARPDSAFWMDTQRGVCTSPSKPCCLAA